ncbi:MAG: acyltransferase [Spirochaetes bacterium RBG_16_49_21]|nr:MAG: acyltransferase [Spirochaetes bacterium RBG_16_49_21]
MFRFLKSQFTGILAVFLLLANTMVCIGPLLITAFIKLLIPFQGFRKLCSIIANGIAVIWISINNFNMGITRKINWDVQGLEGLSLKGWYLVISNHQTWADIVVLQKIFNRRIPLLKFFLKKELIWVPLLGVAWWALDFPFMKRYSAAFLKRHPRLKGKDIEITRKACEKFKTIPVSIMNFVEGTRFTKEKHDRQNSPFRHLLRPKAGGIGFVLAAMGERLTSILNITIIYPQGETSFWAFLCGRINEIKVWVEKIPIKRNLSGDYITDPDFQIRFRSWLNSLWRDKDRLFDAQGADTRLLP